MSASMITRFGKAIDDMDLFLLVARLTLLVLLVNTHDHPGLLLVAAVASAVMFLNERLLRAPWPWFVLTAVLAVSQFGDWWLIDDHRVATTYWLAAVGCARLADEPTRVLRLSARLLVGAMFAFAFGWKLLSSQYTSTDFFRYTLLRDPRFDPVATLVAGADEDQLRSERAVVSEFTAAAPFDEHISVAEGPRTETVATVFTFWGLALEGAIAVAYLLPLRGRSKLARPATILVFCATTYVVVPVVGFGVLLMTLGLTQVDTARLRRSFVLGSAGVFAWGAVMTAVIV